jgi:hypothetical protein
MKQVSLFLLCLVFFSALATAQALAAGTTMAVTPASGSYSKPFTAALVLDGHGDRFNAAQATVTVSAGLAVKDLVLGDCNFSFLHTPTAQSLDFAGVILKGASTGCTVYNVTLVPVTTGRATISLTKASVRRYGDATEVLQGPHPGSYTVTAVANKTAVLGTGTAQPPSDGQYTIILTVVSGKGSFAGLTVTLNAVGSKEQQKAQTDKEGKVRFSSLSSGVYDAVVLQGENKVGESILNVKGPNHLLTLGISLDEKKLEQAPKAAGSVLGAATTSPVLLAGLLGLGVAVGTAVALLAVALQAKLRPKKNS